MFRKCAASTRRPLRRYVADPALPGVLERILDASLMKRWLRNDNGYRALRRLKRLAAGTVGASIA